MSEPVTDYIAWEHYQTRANVEASEEVRWLPRHHGWDLLVPGTDLWIFDGRLIRSLERRAPRLKPQLYTSRARAEQSRYRTLDLGRPGIVLVHRASAKGLGFDTVVI